MSDSVGIRYSFKLLLTIDSILEGGLLTLETSLSSLVVWDGWEGEAAERKGEREVRETSLTVEDDLKR